MRSNLSAIDANHPENLIGSLTTLDLSDHSLEEVPISVSNFMLLQKSMVF